MFQQFLEKVDVEVGLLIALVLGLDGSWVGLLLDFLPCHYLDNLCSTASASSPNAAYS